jgi:hypothetical protein
VASTTPGAAFASPTAASGGTGSDLSSPDGLIIFAEGDASEGHALLFSVWPDGSHRKAIAADRTAHFAVSPDQRQIVIEGSTTAVVNLDGSNHVDLGLPDPTLGSEFFTWSADTSRLAFHGWSDNDQARDGMYSIRSSDFGDLRLIARNKGPLAYAPVGDQILAVGEGVVREGHMDIANLFVERPDGRAAIRLNPARTAVLIEPGSGPVADWSPDGQLIAFAAFDTRESWDFDQTRSSLYVIDADGRHLRRITPRGMAVGSGVQWSPDGSWISSWGASEADVQQVFIVRPDGTDLHSVTTAPAPGACCAVWSPDSRRLLTSELTVVGLDGATDTGPAAADVQSFQYVWIGRP